jgi:hypothetical protein
MKKLISILGKEFNSISLGQYSVIQFIMIALIVPFVVVCFIIPMSLVLTLVSFINACIERDFTSFFNFCEDFFTMKQEDTTL